MKKVSLPIALFLTVLALFCGSASAVEEGVMQVDLLPYVASSDHLYIKDVIDKRSTSSAFIHKYGEVSIPLDHRGGEVAVAHVLSALNRAGANLGNVIIRAANASSNTSLTSSEVTEFVRSVLKQELATHLQTSPDDILIEWTDIPAELPSRNKFSRIATNIEQISSSSGTQRFQIRFITEDGLTLSAADFVADIKFRKSVLVAKRDLNPGELVTVDDFEIAKKVLNRPSAYLHGLEELGAKKWQVASGLASGDAVRRGSLQFSSTMQKGEVVTLTARNNSLQIRALGKVKAVMDDGATVVVENLDSKKELIGKPVGVNEVEILF